MFIALLNFGVIKSRVEQALSRRVKNKVIMELKMCLSRPQAPSTCTQHKTKLKIYRTAPAHELKTLC